MRCKPHPLPEMATRPRIVRISVTDGDATDSSSDEEGEVFGRHRVKRFVNEITIEPCRTRESDAVWRGGNRSLKKRRRSSSSSAVSGGKARMIPAKTSPAGKKFRGVRQRPWGKQYKGLSQAEMMKRARHLPGRRKRRLHQVGWRDAQRL